MDEQNEFGIYIDFGMVNTDDLTPDKVPDDFWTKMSWYEKYNKRDDLRLHILKKDNQAALDRLTGFADDDEDEDENFPRVRRYGFMKDKGDYLSLTTDVMKWCGDYEDVLIDRLVQRLQHGDEEENYLLDTVNVSVYMQKVGGEREDAPSRLAPLDIKQFSAYTDIVGTIIDCAETNDFNGLRCEYVVSGRDRCKLGLFIEDAEDSRDGLRYQLDFHIALYQMPGVFSGSAEGREIQGTENKESYALDCIIANGEKYDSFADFRKWAGAFFFRYRL